MSFYDIDLKTKIAGQHILWEIEKIISFSSLIYHLKDLESRLGRKGYGAEETPDHSYFCRFRKLVGTKRIGKIFKTIVNRSKKAGILRSVFHFVDATAIISKNTTWSQRDKALKEGEEALNNTNIEKYSADKDARFGCKGKQKVLFGYKGHAGMDKSSNLIESIAVTPANVSDQDGFQHICPKDGQMTFGDKSYCLKPAQLAMKAKGAISAAILQQPRIWILIGFKLV